MRFRQPLRRCDFVPISDTCWAVFVAHLPSTSGFCRRWRSARNLWILCQEGRWGRKTKAQNVSNDSKLSLHCNCIYREGLFFSNCATVGRWWRQTSAARDSGGCGCDVWCGGEDRWPTRKNVSHKRNTILTTTWINHWVSPLLLCFYGITDRRLLVF